VQQLPGDAALRDTIAAVFQSSDYSRTWQEILWGRLVLAAQRLREFLQQAAREHPLLFWVSLGVVVTVLVLLLARGAYLARKRADLVASSARFGRGMGRTGEDADAWHLAQKLASAGNYTEAAHALYRHLLYWLASGGGLELHPSKTVGDYARELRMRASSFHGGYRNFARSYEVVIYGLGYCDREGFDRLLSLANAVTGQRG
jgi:hypothetical protein